MDRTMTESRSGRWTLLAAIAVPLLLLASLPAQAAQPGAAASGSASPVGRPPDPPRPPAGPGPPLHDALSGGGGRSGRIGHVRAACRNGQAGARRAGGVVGAR